MFELWIVDNWGKIYGILIIFIFIYYFMLDEFVVDCCLYGMVRWIIGVRGSWFNVKLF